MSERTGPGRPAAAPNNRPTKDEVAAAWRRIREAANAGSVQACALLIALAENKPIALEGSE